MMPMMVSSGGGWLAPLHAISSLLFFVGLVLLLAWAIKHLSGERQKYWGGMCILAAVALWVIAMVASAAMGRGMMGMGMPGAPARPGVAAPRPEEDAGAKASKAAARSSAAAARSAGAASSAMAPKK
jgi:hypothetical protein